MTIAEVSKRYEMSADTLRYYERIGLIPSVTRSKSGIRDYSEEDCRWVSFSKCMRNAGLPIESLIEYVGAVSAGRPDGTGAQEHPDRAARSAGAKGEADAGDAGPAEPENRPVRRYGPARRGRAQHSRGRIGSNTSTPHGWALDNVPRM